MSDISEDVLADDEDSWDDDFDDEDSWDDDFDDGYRTCEKCGDGFDDTGDGTCGFHLDSDMMLCEECFKAANEKTVASLDTNRKIL